MKPKQKQGKTVHVSLVIEATLWAKITSMAQESDVSANFIIRRALIEVINSGRIPWPSSDETRENKKWGAATPVYDAETEEPVKGSGDGRKLPLNPSH